MHSMLLFNTCGQLVQNLRMNNGKKCVHMSPLHRTVGAHSLLAWITPVFYPHSSTASFTLLSTAKPPIFTPVWPLIFPTFHSTYNNHHQFI